MNEGIPRAIHAQANKVRATLARIRRAVATREVSEDALADVFLDLVRIENDLWRTEGQLADFEVPIATEAL
jgi:hypothetical protein